MKEGAQVTNAQLFGVCLGVRLFKDCSTLDLTFYILPGLIFGIGFGTLFYRRGVLTAPRAAAFVVAAIVGNTAAVMVAVPVETALTGLLGFLSFAGAGAIAGAIGGGILGAAASWLLRTGRRWLGAAVGAGLGLLLILLLVPGGAFSLGEILFYVLWQAGFAAALASMLSAETGDC